MINPFDPMPTISSILGMPVAKQMDEAILLDSLDFDIPCQSPTHQTQPEFHDGPAAYLMVIPCGTPTFRCAPLVAALKRDPNNRVCKCGNHHIKDIQFIPLDVTA